MLTCSCPVLDDACKRTKLSYAFLITGTVFTLHPSKKRPLHTSTPFPPLIGLPCLAFTMNLEGPPLHPAELLETRRTRTESSVSVAKTQTTSRSTIQDPKHTLCGAIRKDIGLTTPSGPPLQLRAGAARDSR